METMKSRLSPISKKRGRTLVRACLRINFDGSLCRKLCRNTGFLKEFDKVYDKVGRQRHENGSLGTGSSQGLSGGAVFLVSSFLVTVPSGDSVTVFSFDLTV